ncbi:hypothetical protein CKO15_13630 [Halorhodospira abdelmalekii]|uniref:hypothetical protein n=1 Tax=Halorhodospira abdelmalekii TaxID=421629 RepID=UPI001908E8CC|nr:hypothetical protein [Halorhodospira abdelmalekii]MBK1736281.1 hypothetical protein [Halorhodospira abdelmalekii]
MAFGGIIALTLVLMATHGGATGGGLGEVLPVLGLYAFAGYRMLPAAQHVCQGLAKLRLRENKSVAVSPGSKQLQK